MFFVCPDFRGSECITVSVLMMFNLIDPGRTGGQVEAKAASGSRGESGGGRQLAGRSSGGLGAVGYPREIQPASQPTASQNISTGPGP